MLMKNAILCGLHGIDLNFPTDQHLFIRTIQTIILDIIILVITSVNTTLYSNTPVSVLIPSFQTPSM